MKIQKIITHYIIIGAILGIIFSISYDMYINRLISIVLFGVTLYGGIWTINKSYKKVWLLYLCIFLFQLFSLKIGSIDYSYGVGFNFIHFINLESFKPESTILSLSFSNFISTTEKSISKIGVNIISLVFIILIIYARRKENLQSV